MSKTIQERLSFLQKNLKVEKGQQNKFGGYSYRSSEDILEALKPLLEEDETVTVDEEMQLLEAYGVEARFYKKSIAVFTKGEHSISKSAFTREDSSQKGMSTAQLSGSVGSYGKKYALGNLFAIDDTKDADATNDHDKKASSPAKKPTETKSKDSFKRPARKPKTEVKEDDFDDI